MIAALYVETGGSYFGLPGVDPWDETRDARKYDGPWPVVSHTPCQRWGKLWAGAPLVIKRTGIRKIKGDDDGCFDHSLKTARRVGGVIEHPWGSHAWPHFGLNVPPREGGWINADFLGGWTCCVEQGRYGHYARKPTLLLAYGCDLPSLDWGIGPSRLDPAVIERMGLKRAKRLGEVGARGGGTDSSPRIGTPTPFRDLLISMARSVNRSGSQHDRSPSIQTAVWAAFGNPLSPLRGRAAFASRRFAHQSGARCMTKPARFSQTDITRAIKGVEAAGLRVAGVDIQGDRIVVMIAGQDNAARRNPLDRLHAA